MTPGRKVIAKPFESGGWSYIYLEPRSPRDRTALEAKLKALGAADVEELVAGILTARVPAGHLDELEVHAVVSPMERKSPR